MAYKKLEKPKGLIEAKTRKQAMDNIDKKEPAVVEYGHGTDLVNAAVLGEMIAEIEGKISEHNQHLQDADDIKNLIGTKIKALQGFHSRVLKSAVGKFGANHSYIELLGGTRQEERKRPVRKPKNP